MLFARKMVRLFRDIHMKFHHRKQQRKKKSLLNFVCNESITNKARFTWIRLME